MQLNILCPLYSNVIESLSPHHFHVWLRYCIIMVKTQKNQHFIFYQELYFKESDYICLHIR